MRLIIVTLAIAGLIGCAQSSASAPNDTPAQDFVKNSTIPAYEVQSRESNGPQDIQRLEQKIDRLESILRGFLNQQEVSRIKIIQFNQCSDKCLEIPWEGDDGQTDENEPRLKCFKECDKIRPQDVIGGC